MSEGISIDRAWIATQFAKGIGAERSLAAGAKARADAPPDPALGVLYNEIAEADLRHASVVEAIAIRYGYTPTRTTGGGIGATLSNLKDRVSEMGSDPLDCLAKDLAAKAESIHWYTAWVHAFDAAGDAESSRELSAVLAEENTHSSALQASLNQLVERGALGRDAAKPSKS
jgi:bacterioferritin (cytochrome b1)